MHRRCCIGSSSLTSELKSTKEKRAIGDGQNEQKENYSVSALGGYTGDRTTMKGRERERERRITLSSQC